MKNPEEAKEKIIAAATELIKSSDGTIDTITTRTIAEKAGVGVGLINYHFQTKENLIVICVQGIIGNVIGAFQPPVMESADGIEKVKTVVKLVADFLVENPSVSRISILGDCNRPQCIDNTMRSAYGVMSCMKGLDFTEPEKRMLSFELVSIMQGLFLRKELSKELFGLDFCRKEERDEMLDFTVDRLMKRCGGGSL